MKGTEIERIMKFSFFPYSSLSISLRESFLFHKESFVEDIYKKTFLVLVSRVEKCFFMIEGFKNNFE